MSKQSMYTVDESYYEFDKEFGIFSKPLGKYLKGYAQTEDEYLKVSLKAIGEKDTKTFLYHKVLWEHFNGKVPDGFELNHIDENKHNFKISNLELVTHSQNINHGTRNERVGKKNAEKLRGRKLPEDVKKKIGDACRGKKMPKDVVKRLAELRFKNVDRIDPITGEVLKSYFSADEIRKDGFSMKQVSACCVGFHKTHKGYLWKRPL